MSNNGEVLRARHRGPIGITVPTTPRRIDVAVTVEMISAIDRVSDWESVTVTEAVQRLVGYGEFVFRTTREEGSRIIVRDSRGYYREVWVP